MIKWLKSLFRKKKRARDLDDGRFPARVVFPIKSEVAPAHYSGGSSPRRESRGASARSRVSISNKRLKTL